jgi:hypothetical protein
MTKPVRISGVDVTDEDVRARHAEIEGRLENMGLAKVKIMFERGGFPTEWNPILLAFMAGDKLEKETKKRGDD